jgi:FAD/FMN-containing dehydrogenase
MPSASDLLRRDLASVLDGEVRFDAASRALYSTDASVYQITPLGVVVPRSTADVVKTVEVAARHGVPLTPRGGGTSQAGQAIGAGLVLDTSKCTEPHSGHRSIRARRESSQGGARRAERRPQPHNLHFAPDVSSASRATVGGMMANNSSGARSVSTARPSITSASSRWSCQTAPWSACDRSPPPSSTPRGRATPWRRGPTAPSRRSQGRMPRKSAAGSRRSSAGWAATTSMRSWIRAGPWTSRASWWARRARWGSWWKPRSASCRCPRRRHATAEFDHLLDALAATPVALRHSPAAVEVMDDFILSHTRDNAALDQMRRAIVERDGSTLLCIELYADHASELPPRLQALARDLAASGYPCRTRALTDPAPQARVWSLREAALGLSMAMKGDGKAVSFVEDTAVAPEHLRDYIERFAGIIDRHGTTAGIYAHASVDACTCPWWT